MMIIRVSASKVATIIVVTIKIIKIMSAKNFKNNRIFLQKIKNQQL
jgi:hypothetical protein